MTDTGPTTISPQEFDNSVGASQPKPILNNGQGPLSNEAINNPEQFQNDPLNGRFTRARDPINAQEDPRFIEFLKNQRGSNAAARAAIAKQQGKLELGRDRRLEDTAIQEERGQRNISADFENRGLLSSGRAQRSAREFGGDVERDRSRFLFDLQEKFAELDKRAGSIGSNNQARQDDVETQIRRDIGRRLAAIGVVPNFG